MKALVTGAGGFVGKHLVAHLGACGDDVVTTSREYGPLLSDDAGWHALLAKHRPEVVYHLAGQASVADSWREPEATFAANVIGTLNVLAAARAVDVRRVLVVSSSDVYGVVTPDQLPLTEDAPLRPVTPYAASKAAAELVAAQARFGYGQDVVVVRAFTHLGPGQDNRFVAAAIAERIARNELTGQTDVAVGNLSPKRDLTDVRDVVRAYRLVVEHGCADTIYNVCSGRAIAIHELADLLLGQATLAMRLVSDPDLVRPVEVPLLQGDNGRLVAATGWQPRVDVVTTLQAVLEDARQRVRATAS